MYFFLLCASLDRPPHVTLANSLDQHFDLKERNEKNHANQIIGELFEHGDADQNNKLSGEELESILAKVRTAFHNKQLLLSRNFVALRLAEIDRDNDSKLTFEELAGFPDNCKL
jgi:hypothetical protein